VVLSNAASYSVGTASELTEQQWDSARSRSSCPSEGRSPCESLNDGCSHAGSTPASMLTRALPGNSTCIEPPRLSMGSSSGVSSIGSDTINGKKLRTSFVWYGKIAGLVLTPPTGTHGWRSIREDVLPVQRSHPAPSPLPRSASSPQPCASDDGAERVQLPNPNPPRCSAPTGIVYTLT
jgi:hypothetical protein